MQFGSGLIRAISFQDKKTTTESNPSFSHEKRGMKLQQSLRDKIISSICIMDMRMLDVLLPDDGVYENAYKEVWLGKLAVFFKYCREKGDTVLSVRYSHCIDGHFCDCNLDVWVFEAGMAKKGFAIHIIMGGGEVKGVERCFANHFVTGNNALSGLMLAFEAFDIYDDEKIGFIDSYEHKELRKSVQDFIKDLGNRNRYFVGYRWIRKVLWVYNELFFEALDDPFRFEYKNEMLSIYEDLHKLKNMFKRQKEYKNLIQKYFDFLICADMKCKIRGVKWFLKNEDKVSRFLVMHYALSVENGKLKYFFRIDHVNHCLEIRYPKVSYDMQDCINFQHYMVLLYDFFRAEYIKETKALPYDDQRSVLYEHYKNRVADLAVRCDEWISGVLENRHSVV